MIIHSPDRLGAFLLDNYNDFQMFIFVDKFHLAETWLKKENDKINIALRS